MWEAGLAPGLLRQSREEAILSDDARQLESRPVEAGEGQQALPASSDSLDDYCAACGVRAPEVGEGDPEHRVRGLLALGWLVLPPRALHQDMWPRVARNAMCAACLMSPSPFVRALLDAWGVRIAASLPS